MNRLSVFNIGKIGNLVTFITFLFIAKFIFVSRDLANFTTSKIGTSYFGDAYPKTLFENTSILQIVASILYLSSINLAGVWCLKVLLNERLLGIIKESRFFFFTGFIPGYLLNIALVRFFPTF